MMIIGSIEKASSLRYHSIISIFQLSNYKFNIGQEQQIYYFLVKYNKKGIHIINDSYSTGDISAIKHVIALLGILFAVLNRCSAYPINADVIQLIVRYQQGPLDVYSAFDPGLSRL
jgi:hypothetical protein